MSSHIHTRASSCINNCRHRNPVKVQEKTSHASSLARLSVDFPAETVRTRVRLLFNGGCWSAREFRLGSKSTSSLLNLSISGRFHLQSAREHLVTVGQQTCFITIFFIFFNSKMHRRSIEIFCLCLFLFI